MKNRLKSVLLPVSALAVGAITTVAQAAEGDMPAITFPVSTGSMVTAVVAAGGVLLLAYFGPKVGFAFAKRLLGRLHKSV